MITFIHGDLFESPAEVYVNPVNCIGVMGSGLAAAFKARFPNNFEIYKHACYGHQVKIGNVHIVRDSNGKGLRYIVNFPTKLHWKDPSKIEYVYYGLVALKAWLVREKIKSVAIPKLGCGKGKLDWALVKETIKSVLGDLEGINIIVY